MVSGLIYNFPHESILSNGQFAWNLARNLPDRLGDF
jgi:hypothetical protein